MAIPQIHEFIYNNGKSSSFGNAFHNIIKSARRIVVIDTLIGKIF